MLLSCFRSNPGPGVDQVRVRGVQWGRLQGGPPLPRHLHHRQLQPGDQPRQRPDYCHNHLMIDTLERIFYHVKKREGFLFSVLLLELRLYCSQLTAASVMSASQIAEITAREKLVHIEKLSGHKTVMIFLPRAAGGQRVHTCLQSRSNLQGQHGDIHALF